MPIPLSAACALICALTRTPAHAFALEAAADGAPGRPRRHVRGLLAVALLLATLASPVHAGEGLFGWIYTLDLLPPGAKSIEQRLWLERGQSQGDFNYLRGKTEIEFGIRPDFQFGVYLNTSHVNAYRNGVDGMTGGPGTDVPMMGSAHHDRYRRTRVDSVSLEHIWRLRDPTTEGIGIGLYVEPEIGPDKREIEVKLMLQKNFLDDRLIVASNLSAIIEREQMSEMVMRESMLDLTLGVSWRFANRVAVGLEYRNHREYDGYLFNRRAHSAHFFGPNVHYASKRWWATLAWRHQLPWASTYNEEQDAARVGGRVYGDEHTRDEFMFRIGFPF